MILEVSLLEQRAEQRRIKSKSGLGLLHGPVVKNSLAVLPGPGSVHMLWGNLSPCSANAKTGML